VSIGWLIAAGIVAWTLVAVAFGVWVGRLFAQERYGGWIDIPPGTNINSPSSTAEVRNVHVESGADAA
jgi:hypothetical protein